ncbi:uncharacterized protein [Physcomitrium patens]|uniref:uncharacterized protein isoform X2 n=1 Tax=Physcomitrium patens TaxID=3218 RepID=UPI000D16D42B|nr:uncharacterized protein LOC112274896 isoform X2 [Physcomitrium patens]|eukprot:XP_024360517.1 uncharacterized protein LOC112274896 isoform X2 [Physcomitrella patens]
MASKSTRALDPCRLQISATFCRGFQMQRLPQFKGRLDGPFIRSSAGSCEQADLWKASLRNDNNLDGSDRSEWKPSRSNKAPDVCPGSINAGLTTKLSNSNYNEPCSARSVTSGESRPPITTWHQCGICSSPRKASMNRSDSAPRKSWFKDGYINGRCNTDNQKTNGSISTPTTREFQALSKAGGIKANNQCPKKVMRRNPIAGKYDPQDIPGAYRSRRALIRPPGFYLRPHDCHSSQGEKRALVTENRAQYTNCKPWISRDIYSSAVQAREDNKLHCKSVHPSVNHYIYEDKYAVVR